MKPEHIVVHGSASDWGSSFEIDIWHRGNGWDKIGYGMVVTNGYLTFDDWRHDRYAEHFDGILDPGRPLDLDPILEPDEVQAHAYGLNRKSVSICMIGRHGKYTLRQITRTMLQIKAYMEQFSIPLHNVIGHYEIGKVNPKFATPKTCPDIDMDVFRAGMDLGL